MKAGKHTGAWLIAGFLFVLLTAHLPVVYTLFYHPLTGAPTAQNGAVNLSEQSASQPIVLDGKWSFYWGRLINAKPKPEEKPDFLIRVPGDWSNYQIGGKYLPASGAASYTLTLKNFSDPRPVTVYLPDFGSAYRVYLDGKLTAESGTVSGNLSKIDTTPKAKLYPVTLSAPADHTVAVDVATNGFSGLYMTPVLREYAAAAGGEAVRNDLRLIFFGIALFAFFILVAVYGISFRHSRRSFWLPVLGFLVLLRIMLTTEFYSTWRNTVFGGLSYEATNRLMFFVTFALLYLMIFMTRDFFGVPFSKREMWVSLIYYAALYLFYLFVPRGYYNRYLSILVPVLAFATTVYDFFKVYRRRQNMPKYGLLLYWGVVLAVTGLILDCYYIGGSVYLNLSLSLLVLFTVFLMILSLTYALRAADLYNEYAVFASRLGLAQAEIAMQKEYYCALSEQMNEIRAIRHDQRHFAGVLQRLSDEGQYEKLKDFLRGYARQTDTEPLPVFCENIVANSILGYYFLQAKTRSVPLHCACVIPGQLPVDDSDLCVVLGNALENAIEACEKLPDTAMRFVRVETRPMGGQLLVKIENAYGGKLDIGENGYHSTKESRQHGMGLRNIRKVVEGCGGFLKTEHSETVFTLMAAFPLPGARPPQKRNRPSTGK
jgi:Signal transduction histidine kinase regulating citrate/malate metabolism